MFSTIPLLACGSDTSEEAADSGASQSDAGLVLDAAPTTDAAPTPCDPNPCLNSGVCTPEDTTFTCDCSGTGYAGDRCDSSLPISVSFDDVASLDPTEAAGRPASETLQWNNARGAGAGQGDDGVLADLVDSDNAVSGVSVAWTCQDIEVTNVTGGSTGSQAMMTQGCRSWLGMGDATITFSGLDAHFPNGYDVVLFIGHGCGFPSDHQATFTLTVGADTLMDSVLPTFDGTFDGLDGAGDPGNVYVSAMHSTDELIIGMAATGAAQLPTAAVNGIQLVAR